MLTKTFTLRYNRYQVTERADKLARKGCKSNQIILPSLSYHAEKRTKLVLKNWRDQLRKTPLTGAFGSAASYPPITKPDTVFTLLREQSEVFGHLTQVRTMQGHNPSYLARFNIPHDPECTCGHVIPPDPVTRYCDHVLHNCETYDDHRHLLTAVHRDTHTQYCSGASKDSSQRQNSYTPPGHSQRPGRPYDAPKKPALPGLDLSDLSNQNEIL
jgi:hypothetical protein